MNLPKRRSIGRVLPPPPKEQVRALIDAKQRLVITLAGGKSSRPLPSPPPRPEARCSACSNRFTSGKLLSPLDHTLRHSAVVVSYSPPLPLCLVSESSLRLVRYPSPISSLAPSLPPSPSPYPAVSSIPPPPPLPLLFFATLLTVFFHILTARRARRKRGAERAPRERPPSHYARFKSSVIDIQSNAFLSSPSPRGGERLRPRGGDGERRSNAATENGGKKKYIYI